MLKFWRVASNDRYCKLASANGLVVLAQARPMANQTREQTINRTPFWTPVVELSY